MKKEVVLSVVAFVVVSSLAWLPARAQEAGRETVAEYCAARNDLGLTHGGCVAYFATRNVVPHDASVCQDPDIQASVQATNHGECVKKLRESRQ